jgi:uncharacterized heparinase superfamily protein
VGSFAIQMAKIYETEITAVTSDRNYEWIKNDFNIDDVVDYTKEDILSSSKKYDIRFHMEPGVKLTKTLDNKTILIEIENSGWKFSTNCEIINIESGIYFGNKNVTSENQNICLSGKIKDITQEIKWAFEKIQ